MSADPRDWMWSEACAMLERVEQIHREMFRPGLAAPAVPTWQPPVDIIEGPDSIRIVAALPGVELADIHVAIESGVLVIAGVRKMSSLAGAGMSIQRLEIPYGRFERRIRLQGRFEPGQSEFVNGCLHLTLVKLI